MKELKEILATLSNRSLIKDFRIVRDELKEQSDWYKKGERLWLGNSLVLAIIENKNHLVLLTKELEVRGYDVTKIK